MPTMNGTDLKAVMKEYFRRAYDENDPSVIDELIAPNMVSHGLTPEPTRTREEFKRWYTPFRAAFSEVTCRVEHAIVEGDWICCRLRFSGRHTGDHLGPKASGKRVNLTALIEVRIVDGKAVEAYQEFNHLALMQQIGAA
jgi:predicted ester cyclase